MLGKEALGNDPGNRVLGKDALSNDVDSTNMAVLSDSHNSFNLAFWQKQGAFCWVVKGGGVEHAFCMANEVYSTCFLLLLGGNDVQKLGGLGAAERLGNLVSELSNRDSVSLVVTGRCIPRHGRSALLEEFRVMGGAVYQVHSKHHHFEFNSFDGEGGGVNAQLYIKDRTHLNELGLRAYRRILEWVVRSINHSDFLSECETPREGGGGKAWWRF